MMKNTFTFLLLFIGGLTMGQENNFWQPVKESSYSFDLFETIEKPAAFQLFRLNEAALFTAIKMAPSEKLVPAALSGFILSIPNDKGTIERFTVSEAPVMDEALAARYPGIHSYAGKGIDDPGASIRFDISAQGFHGMILSGKRPTIYIDPLDAATGTYLVVSRQDAISRTVFECLTSQGAGGKPVTQIANRNADDAVLRSYRLALCASGEFSQHWLDGTETTDFQRKSKVLAALNSEMTRANGIFEKDFGLRLVLVANNDAIIYLNAATDPWSSNLNSTTQATCDNVIGNANYDIGHLLHKASNNGNAGCIACVCKTGSKGSGFTSYANPSLLDFFVVDYLTHEMGHQLGANHTFTFSNEGTIAQVEPGSGSTIMGYAGITGSTTDVQAHSDDYFHAISVQQVTNYIKSATGGCGVQASLGNSAPLANAGPDYIIPKSTPFSLTGTGSDPDAGDILSYVWEQNDTRATGTSAVPSATATSGPQFRSYKPSAETSRTFPILSSILAGTNSNKWEVLPSVARTLNFRFTVRDNHEGGGNNKSDDAIVTVSSITGPFAVISPNTAVTWAEGTTQTVTWSVNGTNGSPVNCSNVSILLSTDGGLTFPTVLAGFTANDGIEVITLPTGESNTCRIKVAAADNIFFDISNTNFIIGTALACASPANLMTSNINSSSALISWETVTAASNYDVDYKEASSGNWIVLLTATTSLSANLQGLDASTAYNWRVRANCNAVGSDYSEAGFSTTSPIAACPGIYDVASNGNIGGAATIPLNIDVKGTLFPRGDNDYYRFQISSAGTLTLSMTSLPANYQLSLLNSSGTQLFVSQNNGTANEAINANLAIGTYYARVFPKGNANNSSSCYNLKLSTGTATRTGVPGTLISDSKVRVSPNPTSAVLRIQLSSLQNKAEVSIMDISGRIVQEKIVTHSIDEVDVSRLPVGLYVLRVKEGGIVQSVKFIKQ